MTQRVLWVFAHPDRQSFNNHLFREATAALTGCGVHVETSDLYAMEWNPIITDDDFGDVAGDTLTDRQETATLSGALSADIAGEQAKLTAATTVVLQFPLWWYGMPAILKGWVDRVFTNGFAFGRTDEQGRVLKYGDGGLSGRDFLPVIVAGDKRNSLGPRGISGSIDELMWPVTHGVAHYSGMRSRRPHLIADSHHIDDVRAAEEVTGLVNRVLHLSEEKPIPYRTLHGGDYDRYELTPSVASGVNGFAAHIHDDEAS